MAERFRAVIDPAGPADEDLRHILGAYCRFYQEEPDCFRLLHARGTAGGVRHVVKLSQLHGDANVPGRSDLRHCMGTVLAEAGVEQRLIQELLGHSGIRTSGRYTKPRRPALRRAALKATRLMGVELPFSSPNS